MKSLITLFSILFILVACNEKTPPIDLEKEKQAILKLHNAQRDYHFNKNAQDFTNQLSDSYISVNKGVISSPSKKDNFKRFNNYFSSVEFEEWDDVSEPLIRISEDGKMAYTVVDKLVVVSYEGEDGKTVEGTTHFAWTAIYRKYGDEWKIDCVTSTNQSIE